MTAQNRARTRNPQRYFTTSNKLLEKRGNRSRFRTQTPPAASYGRETLVVFGPHGASASLVSSAVAPVFSQVGFSFVGSKIFSTQLCGI